MLIQAKHESKNAISRRLSSSIYLFLYCPHYRIVHSNNQICEIVNLCRLLCFLYCSPRQYFGFFPPLSASIQFRNERDSSWAHFNVKSNENEKKTSIKRNCSTHLVYNNSLCAVCLRKHKCTVLFYGIFITKNEIKTITMVACVFAQCMPEQETYEKEANEKK